MAFSRIVTKGATSQSVEIRAVTTATGAPVTITSATVGLALWYRRGGVGLKVAITASDLALLSTAWADGGLLLIGDGVHRLDVADAAFATGVPNVTIGGSATGINIEPCDVQLTAQELQTALTPATILATTVDGVALSKIISATQAVLAGKCTVTDNGDGTSTYVFKQQDGTTTELTVTSSNSTSARTATATPQ